MKTNKLIKVLFCLALFASPILTMAADDITDQESDVQDNNTPAAPINDYIPVALLAAVGLGYVALRKKAVAE